MGNAVTSGNPADFSNRLQTYFNPKLLTAVTEELHLSEFAQRQKYPAHGTSIRFFRPRKASTAGVATIVEGTTPTNLTEVAVGYVDVALAQRGGLASITDIVQALDLLNTSSMYVKTMGADAALDLDTVIRNALVLGLKNSNATYTGYFERFAGVVNTANSGNDFTTMNALSTANAKFTRATHLGMVTQLKAGKVPMINGIYPAITPPQVVHDIRQDTTWVAAATRVDTANLYKREQIRLDGAAFIEATNPFIEKDTYNTNDATGGNYSTLYLGEAAFGCPELANDKAGGSPMGPRMIILAQPDKADPLNLKVTIGWKCYYGAAPLITNVAGEVPHYAILRSKSTWE